MATGEVLTARSGVQHWQCDRRWRPLLARRSHLQESACTRPRSQTTCHLRNEGFPQWAEAAGVQASKIAQTHFGGLRGFEALADIPRFEVLAWVPRTAALVLRPNQGCPPNLAKSEYWQRAPWFIKVSLLLLDERRKGRASWLWGYIQQLPSGLDLPLRWSEAELQELQYPPVIEEVRIQLQQWQDLYRELEAAVEATPGAPNLSWEEYLWAMEIVCSRVYLVRYPGIPLRERLSVGALALGPSLAFLACQDVSPLLTLLALPIALGLNAAYDALLAYLELPMYAMVPVVDGINHHSSVQSKMAYSYIDDSFWMSTDRAFRVGEQVFQAYGPHCNDSLLMYYGFVEQANRHDTYLLAVPLKGVCITMSLPADGTLEADGFAAVRAALEAEGCKSEDSAQAAHQAILEACQAELARQETTIADDGELLQLSQLLSPRARLATEFRLEKKKVLELYIAQQSRAPSGQGHAHGSGSGGVAPVAA